MGITMIYDSIVTVTTTIMPLIINLILALIMLLVAWLVATGLQMLVSSVLKMIRIDKGLQKIKFNQFLTKGEIKRAPSDLIGDLVYWAVIFISVAAITFVYGPEGAQRLLDTLLSYSVSVFAAIFILGLSMFLSMLIATVVTIVANNAGLANGKTLSKVSQYSVIIFGFLKALEILGISAGIIVASFSVIVGAIGLAFAIAFGLGCKDIAADFIENLFKGK